MEASSEDWTACGLGLAQPLGPENGGKAPQPLAGAFLPFDLCPRKQIKSYNLYGLVTGQSQSWREVDSTLH